ncbi:MAG: hypothetical protein ACREJB_04785, partial [Planctomycetaceae bacterium]
PAAGLPPAMGHAFSMSFRNGRYRIITKSLDGSQRTSMGRIEARRANEGTKASTTIHPSLALQAYIEFRPSLALQAGIEFRPSLALRAYIEHDRRMREGRPSRAGNLSGERDRAGNRPGSS